MKAPPSGATLWEVRTLANEYLGLGGMNMLDQPDHYRKAILAEALCLLADTIERNWRAYKGRGAGVTVRHFPRDGQGLPRHGGCALGTWPGLTEIC